LKPQGPGLWEELDDLIKVQDAPTHAPEVYSNWCMMRAVAQCDIKVLLSGQGGDELFAGYNWYPKYLLASMARKGKLYSLIRELTKLPKNFPNSNTSGYFMLLGTMLHALLPITLKLRIKPELRCMDSIMHRYLRSRMRERDFDNLRILDPSGLDEKLYYDLNYSNIPHYLHYEDSNSMAFGIEERVPFLDHRLVEWAHQMAVWWKIRSGVSKLPLRNIMKDLLPEAVVNRRDKMGLSAPKDQWFRNELRTPITDLFAKDCRIFENWIDRKAFLNELDVYMRGEVTPLSRLLWRCINLEKWLQIYT
jgi:asparagine synthase (glutamine-hydrolysing)